MEQMANAAVTAWTACLRDLQQLTHDTFTAAGSTPEARKAFAQCVAKLKQQPALPNAAWKRLVQDEKVMCADRQTDRHA